MADNETRVTYKAIADFTALSRAVRKVKRELAELRAEEAALNKSSATGSRNAASAREKSASAVDKEAAAFEREASAIGRGVARAAESVRAHNDLGDAATRAASATDNLASSVGRGAAASARSRQEHDNAAASADRLSYANGRLYTTTTRLVNGVEVVTTRWQRMSRAAAMARMDLDRSGNTMNQVLNRANQLQKGLTKVGNWRPRLTPPFIALIPIIGAVLALINPLVAGLGAVGSAALGFGASLGSLAGAAIGVLPALGALLSVVGAIKAAFSGVGNVFKAYGAAQKAAGGGGGGGAPKQAELTMVEKVARAQENYRRAVEDVAFAQDDLDESRKGYIKRLKDLQKAVDRAAQSEARAAANSQLARENYANVLADPGSTKGDKMLAQVDVDEAVSDQTDVIDENKQNAADLAEMKRKGIDGDRDVIAATRAVTDALNAQRDAQLAVANAGKDFSAASGGAASAADQFQDALNKLSPSARSVVLQLIAMKGAFEAMKRTVQEAFFSEIVDDIKLINKLFPVTTDLLSGVATSLGQVASQFLRMVTGPEWLRDIGIFSEFAQPFVKAIGEGLLFILDGLKDVTIAALPFTTALGEGFRKGAENFRVLMGSARADGSLATYLDGVLDRLGQWWRITKNIAKTLTNYGTAAGQFADWITDGFERVTEGWLDSSRAAKEAGSPFQTYLENIKPLLSNINGLLGDFFAWLGKTMADPKNIAVMNDIITTIRDDLGPALGDIIQTLADTGVGESFVETLAQIIGVLDTIIQNGGADAIKAFFEAVGKFFEVVQKIAEIPGAGAVISTIAMALGGLAALSFIGKFTGLTSLFGWLIRLAKTQGMASLLSRLGGLVGLGGAAGGATAAGGGAAGATATGAAAGGGIAAAAGAAGRGIAGAGRAVGGAASGAAGAVASGAARAARGLFGTPGYRPSSGPSGGVSGMFNGIVGNAGGRGAANISSLAPEAGVIGKLGPALGKLAGGVAKFAKGGVGPASILSLAGSLGGDAIKNNAASGKEGGGARAGGGILSAASTGAGIGATAGGLLGSVVPVIGTAAGAGVGAAVGGAVGGAVGFAQADEEDRQKFLDDTMGMFSDFFTVNLPNFFKSVGTAIWDGLTTFGDWLADSWDAAVEWLMDLPNKLAYAAGYIWENLIMFGEWLGTTWDAAVVWVQGLPQRIADAAGNVWNLIVGIGTWLGERWEEFRLWVVGLPQAIADTAGNIWANIQSLNVWLGDRWEEFRVWVSGLPKSIGEWAGNVWNFIKNLGPWLASRAEEFRVWVSGLPRSIGIWAGDVWNNIKGIGTWLADKATDIKEWVQGLPARIGNWAGNIFRNITGSISASFAAGRSDARNGKYNGGPILKRAGGGGVPGVPANSDTVPAMLTPGEFVVRKAIVNRIGMDNLVKLNAGVMSYADMLARASKSKQDGNDTGMGGSVNPGDMSFFNGGGLVPSLNSSSTPFDAPNKDGFGGQDKNYGPTFGDINIYNPVPEQASESLPRTLRKVGYLGAVKND